MVIPLNVSCGCFTLCDISGTKGLFHATPDEMMPIKSSAADQLWSRGPHIRLHVSDPVTIILQCNIDIHGHIPKCLGLPELVVSTMFDCIFEPYQVI